MARLRPNDWRRRLCSVLCLLSVGLHFVRGDCPAGSFTVSEGSGEAVAQAFGRLFYANDMCGVDAGTTRSIASVIEMTAQPDLLCFS